MELVRLSTQDVSKAIPITDTKIISEKLSISHRAIKKHIKERKDYFLRFGLLVACATESTGGRPEEILSLNEEQATFLMTLLKNTDEVVEFKFRLVKAFYIMKNELQFRKETRNISVKVRKELTSVIKDNCIDEGNFKRFAYSNYSKLVYKKVLGKDVKKLKEERKLKEKDNIRDFLTLEEIERVQEVESKIATLIESWKMLDLTDKEIYEKIKEKI